MAEKLINMIPDPQLVYESQRVTNAANVHSTQQALKWYEHWCRVGNVAAAELSARRLKEEIAKAWKTVKHTKKKAS